jgi:AcrR family transcriptional regulator
MADAPAADRRQRRRQDSIDEVLGHALEIMAVEGVAGLSLGEIARRMGIRPPSLYVYFPSKHAIYDALFERGWRLLLEEMQAFEFGQPPEGDAVQLLTLAGERFTRWAVEQPAYAQLMFWRPVPGFQPSESAYAPAVQLYSLGTDWFDGLREHGLLAGDADTMVRQWTVLVSGVISQQLANAPDEPFDGGQFTAEIPELAAMFAAHHAPRHRPRTKRAATTPSRRQHVRTR